jgi:hypothetical protein
MGDKKYRKNPWEMGSISEIYKKVIPGPFLQYKPSETTLSEWNSFLFHTKYRTIKRYVAVRDFDMPGLYYLAPRQPVQGLGYREVSEGTLVYVREDSREPDRVDVEFQGGLGGRDQVFQLNQIELNRILPHLYEQHRKKYDNE